MAMDEEDFYFLLHVCRFGWAQACRFERFAWSLQIAWRILRPQAFDMKPKVYKLQNIAIHRARADLEAKGMLKRATVWKWCGFWRES
jgi:hypothetical protein